MFPRTLDGEVEAAQSVSGQRIGSALEHDGARPVHLHHFPHNLKDKRVEILNFGSETSSGSGKSRVRAYRFEDGLVRLVVDAVPQRVVHRVVLSLPGSDVLRRWTGTDR